MIFDQPLSLRSPAKLNLFLHVNGRRTDGYHELQTYFQLIDLCDEMTFSLQRQSGFHLDPELPGVNDQDNLIYRAYKAFLELSGLTFGLKVSCHKHIPMGGGLGGGSSNAATTLLALNHLSKCDFSIDELAAIGQHLGADVPVFVRGQSAHAQGIGEQLEPLSFDTTYYLVAMPTVAVSTTAVFTDERLTRDTPKKKIAPASDRSLFFDFTNDCEPLVRELHPEIDVTIRQLSQYGKARLTGTGACCFCEVDSLEQAQQACDELKHLVPTMIAQSINQSPASETIAQLKQHES